MPRGRNEAVAESMALEAGQEQLEQAPVEQELPEWLDPKFKSVEDQARAYAEAQSQMTSSINRANAAEATIAQLGERLQMLEEAQQQQVQPAYDASTDPYLLAAQQAYEEGDFMRAQQINDMRTAQIVQAALQQYQPQQQAPEQNMDMLGALLARDMKDRYGDDWETIRAEVTQHAAQYLDPEMPYERMRDTLTFIGDKVSGDRKLAEQTARLQNQQQSEQQKRLAQTAPGGSGQAWNAPQSGADEYRDQWKRLGLIS